jgi:acetyltransferase-like isoleucine patch superfamily enzyme
VQLLIEERLRGVFGEMAAAAEGKRTSELIREGWSMAAARYYLRRCTRVGPLPRVYGRPRIYNKGTFTIGERVRISSTIARTELAAISGGVLEIGDNVSINYGTSIAATGLVRIGRDCMLGSHSMILDNDFHEIEDRNAMPAPRPVILEDNVWLANRAIVLPGVTIGRDSVIGAGSVVMTDIPPRCLAIGNPARVMKRF